MYLEITNSKHNLNYIDVTIITTIIQPKLALSFGLIAFNVLIHFKYQQRTLISFFLEILCTKV